MVFTKQEMKEKLTNAKYEVTFTKADGSKRVMKCTLIPEVLKPYLEAIEERKAQMLSEGKEYREKPENPDVLSVIDLEKNAWRSFRLDSITDVKEIKE